MGGIGVAVQFVNLIILCAGLYALYTIIVRIPQGIKENTELNQQLLSKLDKIAEALEKQQKRD